MDIDEVVAQINRYFVATHGSSYVYRAPETFGKFEQWLMAIQAKNGERANEHMTDIEAHFQNLPGRRS